MNTIRKAYHADIQPLKALYHQFVADMNRFDPDDANLDDEVMLWIKKSIIEDNSIIFVSEDETGLQGFARVQCKERTSDNGGKLIHYAKLSDLYVSPGFRRKGIAGQLLKVTTNWAESLALTEMILNVYEKNKTAYLFYKYYGFTDHTMISNGRIRMRAPIVSTN